jgi:hypothetical protein
VSDQLWQASAGDVTQGRSNRSRAIVAHPPHLRWAKNLLAAGMLMISIPSAVAAGNPSTPAEPLLHRDKLAADNFGADAPWFLRNIPFLEIDDQEIQEVYYYRWKLFRSHIREIGPQGTTIIEFLDNVAWAAQTTGISQSPSLQQPKAAHA